MPWILSNCSGWELGMASAALVSTAAIIYRHFTDPLRGIPGPNMFENPPWKSMTLMMRGNAPADLLAWHKKYGPVIRVGSIVSIADADFYRTIYGTYRFPKAKFYAETRFNGASLFDILDRNVHRHRKSFLAGFYGTVALKAAEQEIKDVGIYVLIRKLEKFALQGKTVNLLHEFHLMTFDVIGKLAFGRYFNTLLTNDHPIFRWIDGNQRHIFFRMALGPFAKLLPDPQSAKEFQEFTLSAIRERRHQIANEKDVVMLLLNGMDEQGNHLMDQELVPEMVVQLVAGTDTTALSLSWTMYYLMNHKDIMNKLKQEIFTAIPSLDLNDITYDAVQHLPYLDAVIKEVMRIRPVAAILLPREVPQEGLHVHGYYLPEGTIVGIGAYTLHHSTKYFNNPDEFIPERWLTADDETMEKMKKAYVPFSLGVRRCLGMHLAMLEMKICLASIIQKFEFEYVPGASMLPQSRFVFRPQDMRVDAKLKVLSS